MNNNMTENDQAELSNNPKEASYRRPHSDGSSSSPSSSEEESPGMIKTLHDVTNEENYCEALGILPLRKGPPANGDYWDDEDEIASKTGAEGVSNFYNLVPNPDAVEVDLSVLRGATFLKISAKERMKDVNHKEGSDALNGLSEIVPDLVDPSTHKIAYNSRNSNYKESNKVDADVAPGENVKKEEFNRADSMLPIDGSFIKRGITAQSPHAEENEKTKDELKNMSPENDGNNIKDDDEISRDSSVTALKDADVDSRDEKAPESNEQDITGFEVEAPDDSKTPKARGSLQSGNQSSNKKGQKTKSGSVSSVTVSTHEVRMPMYLPTFKPATGCTNASDFIVRCFVARLRSGITVVKHGRSRWCKSRLRILHVHQDGRSLSWKPALGEPTSTKRPPKLDLSTCAEVRHAWSPDPLYPMYTGTLILRNKCEAANAHKSFALIFPKRTVDITAVTADQCKVLMEGFSALCFRLQVANLAGQGGKKQGNAEDEKDGPKSAARDTPIIGPVH